MEPADIAKKKFKLCSRVGGQGYDTNDVDGFLEQVYAAWQEDLSVKSVKYTPVEAVQASSVEPEPGADATAVVASAVKVLAIAEAVAAKVRAQAEVDAEVIVSSAKAELAQLEQTLEQFRSTYQQILGGSDGGDPSSDSGK